MKPFTVVNRTLLFVLLLAGLALAGCIQPVEPPDPGHEHASPGLTFVDFTDLNGGADGVALVDLDPDSEHFGEIIQRYDIGADVLPHHLYFNHDESRLYTTALSGDRLYEVILERDANGVPAISETLPIDVGDNIVGEDMYFTEDGSRFYMTFLGGQGGDKDGTVGVFDAQTNELLKTISAPVPDDPASGQPFILWPHGISANEALGLLMVTSAPHPDMQSGAGNTVTAIDLATDEAVSTHLVAESWDDLSAPVEVLLLRDDLPPFALVTTVNGGDIWVAPYDEATKSFGEFTKQVEGEEAGLGVALEFYIHQNQAGEKELFVSFAHPGVVNVYSLDSLPALPLKRTLLAEAGAHHMLFFTTQSGREVMVVQNNLINLEGLNTGTLTVIDLASGDVVKTLDLASEHGLLPESIESAFGHGHDYHH
ncbi:MAG: hypothetical protein DCC55_20090 [Chloroflexi bacterium]|nr:MAG: hypothetical protein DCC55_20090 [Chloroflexota bacterium]